MVTFLPSTTFYLVNQRHVDLVYLNDTGLKKKYRVKEGTLLNPLASNLESSPKLNMSIPLLIATHFR